MSEYSFLCFVELKFFLSLSLFKVTQRLQENSSQDARSFSTIEEKMFSRDFLFAWKIYDKSQEEEDTGEQFVEQIFIGIYCV